MGKSGYGKVSGKVYYSVYISHRWVQYQILVRSVVLRYWQSCSLQISYFISAAVLFYEINLHLLFWLGPCSANLQCCFNYGLQYQNFHLRLVPQYRIPQQVPQVPTSDYIRPAAAWSYLAYTCKVPLFIDEASLNFRKKYKAAMRSNYLLFLELGAY